MTDPKYNNPFPEDNSNPFANDDWARDIFEDSGNSGDSGDAGRPNDPETAFMPPIQADRPRTYSQSGQQYGNQYGAQQGQYGYAAQPGQYGQPGQPGQPAQQNKSNKGLVFAVVGLSVVLVAVLGGVGGYVMRNSGEEPQSPETVAAGDSSSSTAEQAQTQDQPQTLTETVTSTAAPAPSQGRTSEPTRSSAPTTTAASGNVGKRAFGMDRADIDEKGWVGSTARCSGRYYARMLAKTEIGKVVICENSDNRQQHYYIGDFGDISENPDAYPVESYSTRRVEAVNQGYTYTVTPDAVTVTQDGEEIFYDSVIDFGTLNAG